MPQNKNGECQNFRLEEQISQVIICKHRQAKGAETLGDHTTHPTDPDFVYNMRHLYIESPGGHFHTIQSIRPFITTADKCRLHKNKLLPIFWLSSFQFYCFCQPSIPHNYVSSFSERRFLNLTTIQKAFFTNHDIRKGRYRAGQQSQV